MFTLYSIEQFEYSYINNELVVIAHCKKKGNGSAKTLAKSMKKCKRELKSFLRNNYAKRGIVKLSGRYDFYVNTYLSNLAKGV